MGSWAFLKKENPLNQFKQAMALLGAVFDGLQHDFLLLNWKKFAHNFKVVKFFEIDGSDSSLLKIDGFHGTFRTHADGP